MGLTGHPQSQGQQQDAIRSVEQQLAQAKEEVRDRSYTSNIVCQSLREEQESDRRHSSQMMFYHSIGRGDLGQSLEQNVDDQNRLKAVRSKERRRQDKLSAAARNRVMQLEKSLAYLKANCDPWQSTFSTPIWSPKHEANTTFNPPVTPPAQPVTNQCPLLNQSLSVSYEQLWHERSGFECIKSLLWSNLSRPNGASSDNVALFLDNGHRQTAEPWEQFRPSLLTARFERWLMLQDRQRLQRCACANMEQRTDSEDLLFLDAESDILRANNLDTDTYMNLCFKHQPRLSETATRDIMASNKKSMETSPGGSPKIGATRGSNSSTCVASPEFGPVGNVNRGFDPLHEYCTLDDSQGHETACETSTEPAMELPNILAWSAVNPDAVILGKDKDFRGSPSVDFDFVMEEPLPVPIPLSGIADNSALNGAFKEVWPKLDEPQRHHLMRTIARLLRATWDNFDLLDRKSCKGHFFGGSMREHSSGITLAPELEQEQELRSEEEQKQEQELKKELERIHECTKLHLPDASEVLSRMTVPSLDTKDHSNPCRRTAMDHLCILEDEFLNRSFLDAFNEATKPLPREGIHTTQSEINHGRDTWNSKMDLVANDSLDQYAPFEESIHDNRATALPHPRHWGLLDETCQLTTTTKARAQESIVAQEKAYILPLYFNSRQECSRMRRFDFSLDDLLIQVAASKDSDANPNPRIVGVSRWKTVCPVKTTVGQTVDSVPRSCNKFQAAAQLSTYPLVHLFSLPDVFCPAEFGGQDVAARDTGIAMDTLAYGMARLLVSHSPPAAEFMTLSLAEKELVLYHRWMAAWHERSPSAPKSTRKRFEIINTLNRHRSEEKRRRSQRGCGADAGVRVSNPIAPKILRPSFQEHQPVNDEPSVSMAPTQCPRCADESNEKQMMAQDLAHFEEACRFMDKISDGVCSRQSQLSRAASVLDEILGLSSKELQMAQALQLGVSNAADATEGATVPVDEQWRLSEEECAVVRKELFGEDLSFQHNTALDRADVFVDATAHTDR
ncbi:hypothetical protein EDD21DRAFT_429996 [Dissophora ornata]|nr:hypothetical protein EDD21DRAFT_429996 [Dissophora ornata]